MSIGDSVKLCNWCKKPIQKACRITILANNVKSERNGDFALYPDFTESYVIFHQSCWDLRFSRFIPKTDNLECIPIEVLFGYGSKGSDEALQILLLTLKDLNQQFDLGILKTFVKTLEILPTDITEKNLGEIIKKWLLWRDTAIEQMAPLA